MLHRHPTHILSPNNCHRMRLRQGIGTETSLKWTLYTRTPDFTAFMLSTCAKLLQWLRYLGFYFTQAPHTYCVSKQLPSHASSSWNSHRNITEMNVIDTDSRFHCFYAVNLCQAAAMIAVSWIPLHTGTPRILCLPTTAIACVFVME